MAEQRQWWVNRWLELLDSYRFKKRLERARNYAREGNVLSLEFTDSQLLALVQGTDVEPYRVTLNLDPFSDEDWHYVVATLAEKAIYAAQLLAGAMPVTIEQVFVKNGLSLFPFNLAEVHSRCSCPDKANPCKHIGAVYYQLADQFQEDPFVIFRLRGRTRGQLLDQLSHYRRLSPSQLENYDPNYWSPGSKDVPANLPTEQKTKVAKLTKVQQQQAIQQFWTSPQTGAEMMVAIAPCDNPVQLLDRLGEMPLNYELAKDISQALNQIYNTVSQQLLAQAMGSEES